MNLNKGVVSASFLIISVLVISSSLIVIGQFKNTEDKKELTLEKELLIDEKDFDSASSNILNKNEDTQTFSSSSDSTSSGSNNNQDKSSKNKITNSETKISGETYPIIIDHTSVNEFDKIPDEYINKVKNMIVQYVGESHGFQLPQGLLLLEQQNSKYSVQLSNDLNDLTESGALKVLRAQQGHSGWTYVGDERYWTTETARIYTETTSQQANLMNMPLEISIWAWCWDISNENWLHDENGNIVTFNDERMDAYLNAVSRFNNNPESTKFIYHTSITDTKVDIRGWRVTHYNEEIRQAAIANNGILFDQADIENWNNDNTEKRIDTWNGHTLYLRHADYNENIGSNTYPGTDHTNDALRIRKAKAFWVLLAKLSGWDGNTEPEPQEKSYINIDSIPSEVETYINDGKPFFGAAVSEMFFNNGKPVYEVNNYYTRLKELFTWGVTMNTGKMWRMHPNSRYEYFWDDLDIMTEWFENNNMKLKYHTLVWDNPQNPQWYNDLSQTEKKAALEEHVRNIMKRYKGRITMYDVVNEPLHRGDLNDYMGTGWTGAEAITNIFNWAREEDPNAELLINEYFVLIDNQWYSVLQDYIDLINEAKEMGAPIDAIGVQAHMGVIDDSKILNDEVIINALNELSSQTDLPIHITEFDICTPGNGLCPGDPNVPFEEYDNWWEYQAWAYPHAYELFNSHPAVKSVFIWGFYDVGIDGPGLFFAETFEPKPVYYTLSPILKNWVDYIGTTKINNYEINSGDYTLILNLNGYYDYEESFTINEGETKTFDIALQKKPTIHYIRAGATGSNDGGDWKNAYTQLPLNLQRGHTYYIADGIYPEYTFNDPEDGEKYIYIKKATINNHGTDVGWHSSYGNGQSIFRNIDMDAQNIITFETGYWIFDGQVGYNDGSEKLHGFKIDYTFSPEIKERTGYAVDFAAGVSNIDLSHIEIDCNNEGSAWETADFEYKTIGLYSAHGVLKENSNDNINLEYCYLHDVAGVHILIHTTNNWLIENNYFSKRLGGIKYESYPNGNWEEDYINGESIAINNAKNFIIRYNTFQDIYGTASIEFLDQEVENFDIYGNIFFSTSNNYNFNIGIITGTSDKIFNNINIYNNVFANFKRRNDSGLAGIAFSDGTDNDVYNNLWYDCNSISNTNVDHDYNYYSNSEFAWSTSANEHDVVTVDDPFVNSANYDFHLIKATEAGINHPWMNNLDIDGNIRGEDDNWDRGAYECVGCGNPSDLIGDFSNDGCVNDIDFDEFKFHYLKEVDNTNWKYDINNDGKIDIEDFSIFGNNYNTGSC